MSSDLDTLWRDFVLLVAALFIVIVLLVLHRINPPAQADVQPGDLAFLIVWPDGAVDVDLWLRCPGDNAPVGYSRKSGTTCDLLRDDLGAVGDIGNANFETAFSRGAPEGEYVVNVHLYRSMTRVWPVPVAIEVRQRDPAVTLYQGSGQLAREGEEITLARFVYADGRIGPVHWSHEPLRARAR